MDRVSVICKLAMKWYLMRMCASYTGWQSVQTHVHGLSSYLMQERSQGFCILKVKPNLLEVRCL